MASATIWYVDADDGDNGNGGASTGDAFADLSTAIDAAVSDGGANQIIRIMAASAATNETAQKTFSLDSLTIEAYDASNLTPDDTGFDFDSLPVVNCNMTGDFLRPTHASALTVKGIEFNGLTTCDEAYGTTTTGATLEASDCIFRGFDQNAVRVKQGSVFQRCLFRDSVDGAMVVGASGTSVKFESCIFLDCTTLAIDKHASSHLVELRNCLITGCGASTYPIDFATTSTYWVIENCIFFDNPTTYALPGSTYTANNCYTSDGATYHTTDNYSGTADADDYEHNPLFADAAAEDYHLQTSSPLLSLGTAVSVTLLYDRAAMPATPPIGPLFAATTPSPRVIPRGTHQFLVKMDSGFLLAAHGEEDHWTLTGEDRPPWVATVTLGGSLDISGTTVYTQATVTTDRALKESVSYTLTTSEALYDSQSWTSPSAFSGLRPSLTGGAESTPAPILLDLHAPWVREDGLPGGFFEIGADGTYTLTGGIHTVKKAVWAWLLTRLRELHYAPEFGSFLELKQLRPADLRERAVQLADAMVSAIPWVDSAHVTMQFRDNHLRVGVVVRAFGREVREIAEVAA